MKLRQYSLALSALAFATAFAALTPANAQTTQVYVGKTGAADTVGCGATFAAAPCLTLTHALTQAATAGTIIIKETGIYDPVTVAQSVTILGAEGVNAWIYSTSATPPVIVNNASTDDFKLLGVNVIAGSGTNATVGIQINSARRVELSGNSIRGFTQNAISVTPTAPLDLQMRALTLSGHSSHCIFIRPTGSGTVRFVLRDSRIDHCGNAGLRAEGLGTTGVSTPVVTGNIIGTSIFAISQSGVAAVSGTSDSTNGSVSIQLNDTKVQNATIGVTANGTRAFVHMKSSSIFNCGTGVNAPNNQVFTYFDNLINANTSNGTTTVQVQPR